MIEFNQPACTLTGAAHKQADGTWVVQPDGGVPVVELVPLHALARMYLEGLQDGDRVLVAGKCRSILVAHRVQPINPGGTTTIFCY